MQVDVLIVGQGICGTLLSWFLHKEGRSFLVIDDGSETNSSKAAAGTINPVTGRRYVTTWMADELLDFACLTYTEIETSLKTTLLSSRSIIDFFPSPQMRNAFLERIQENDRFLHSYPDQNRFNPLFHYDFGCGEISPAYTVAMTPLLSVWRKRLTQTGCLKNEGFLAAELVLQEDSVRYHDITAKQIVFCEGAAVSRNPWFSLLPFSANKGEALVLECAGLNRDHMYKKGMLLVPLATENQFWFGSNYQWDFADAAPSALFYKMASEMLRNFIKSPFRILDHKAAIRPATLERRPFVGFHPQFPVVGILNGMGTKGASLAPFFAHQLTQFIVHGLPIAAEADVHRFQRILSK